MIDTKIITRVNKLKYVHLYICVKTTTNRSTAQSQLVELLFDQVLHGKSPGFHCFIANLKSGSKSIDLILLGMSFHTLGANKDNDSVLLYTDFTGLV